MGLFDTPYVSSECLAFPVYFFLTTFIVLLDFQLVVYPGNEKQIQPLLSQSEFGAVNGLQAIIIPSVDARFVCLPQLSSFPGVLVASF